MFTRNRRHLQFIPEEQSSAVHPENAHDPVVRPSVPPVPSVPPELPQGISGGAGHESAPTQTPLMPPGPVSGHAHPG